MFSLIAAVDQNNAIGMKGQLLCYLPNDLKYFKRVTSGHTVIMGRITYASLPVKPLPNRKNIVLSASLDKDALPDCVLVSSIEEVVKQCNNMEENFVIGGAHVYQQMLPFADKLYITRIGYQFEADAFFPVIDPECWQLHWSESHSTDEKHLYPYTFEIYLRKN